MTKNIGLKADEIEVVINQELEREFLGYVDTIKIISPQSLVDFMAWKFRLASETYEKENGKKDILYRIW